MRYGAVLADPPWTFATYSDKGKGRSAENHYNCMSFSDIVQIGSEWLIKSCNDDCVLFLWTTDPMLERAFEIIKAWGFHYKTVAFTWAKTDVSRQKFPIGCGYWTRSNPEQCLLATRGKPKRLHADVRQLVVAPRREHSRKPDEIHERIERLVAGPYLELFGRQRRSGWTTWGDEPEKFGA